MNKLFAPFLPPWAETGLQPAFYDLESGTVLQQTARMYDKVNQLIRLFNELSVETQTTVTEYIAKFTELKDFVDNYFDNLDVQEEVNKKLDEMVESGELGELVSIAISIINNHKSVLVENIINGTSTRVACAGDSLTWCQKPSTPSQQLTTWESMLESFINSWYNNVNLLTVENYGVGGEESVASLSKFNTYTQNDPDTIFWAYGTNDMSHGVTVDGFINNLKSFYEMCVNADIEMIVIIAPPSYQSIERRQKMFNLHNAEVEFCEKYGIRYIDMFNYVENLYKTNSAKQNLLQSDNTHFSDYSCYKDAILTELFPCVFKQSEHRITYVPIGKARNYVHTNGNESTTDVNILGTGYRFREGQEENYLTINLELTKKSKVYLMTYGNRTAGKIDVTIDGNSAGTIDTQLDSESSSTTTTELQEILQLGGAMNGGLHTITLNNPDYSDSVGSNSGRIYLFGFIIEEITEPTFNGRFYQSSKQSIIWNGSSSSLTDESVLQDIKKYNKILLVLGNVTNGLTFTSLYPHDIFHQFSGTSGSTTVKYNFVANNNGTAECCAFTMNFSNNTISFTTSGSLLLKKVIGVVSNETQGYNAETLPYINSGINWQ